MNTELLKDLFTQNLQVQQLVNQSFKSLKESLDSNPSVALKTFTLGTEYHKQIMSSTRDIIKLLQEEQAKAKKAPEVEAFLNESKEYYIPKYLKGLQYLSEIVFVPKSLPICPHCGGYIGEQKCKVEPVYVYNNIIGYTVVCGRG